MGKPKIKTPHMEVAVAKLFNFRKHTIVPNVSWGLGLNHECDMLILDNRNRFTEVELKISLTDFKADFKKPHNHESPLISRMFYALPYAICKDYAHLIPPHIGVICVYIKDNYPNGKNKFVAEFVKHAQHDKSKPPPPKEVINKFYQLGCMRIWSLKEKLNPI